MRTTKMEGDVICEEIRTMAVPGIFHRLSAALFYTRTESARTEAVWYSVYRLVCPALDAAVLHPFEVAEPECLGYL